MFAAAEVVAKVVTTPIAAAHGDAELSTTQVLAAAVAAAAAAQATEKATSTATSR